MTVMEQLEKQYDIEFIGMQERVNNSSLLTFNDTQTKPSFMVEYIDDIPEKIKEVRKRFRR